MTCVTCPSAPAETSEGDECVCAGPELITAASTPANPRVVAANARRRIRASRRKRWLGARNPIAPSGSARLRTRTAFRKSACCSLVVIVIMVFAVVIAMVIVIVVVIVVLIAIFVIPRIRLG